MILVIKIKYMHSIKLVEREIQKIIQGKKELYNNFIAYLKNPDEGKNDFAN